MAIRQFKPVTPSSRSRSVPDFSEITRTHGEKSLMEPLIKSGGRDNHGHSDCYGEKNDKGDEPLRLLQFLEIRKEACQKSRNWSPDSCSDRPTS